MRLATLRFRFPCAPGTQSLQLVHHRVYGVAILLHQREQAQPNHLASIQQVSLPPEFHAKSFDPILIVGAQRERRMLGRSLLVST
jgi:hypothetical protein